MSSKSLLLASKSPARQAMLRNAGIEFLIQPANLAEATIIADAQAQGVKPLEITAMVASAKALAVAAETPQALVIGADQILVCDGVLYQKAADRSEAALQLRSLRGRAHTLISAVCVAQDNHILWRHTDHAQLTMKNFDDEFLQRYLAMMGDRVLQTVGGYALEGLGTWLFDQVTGDYFTILGMPLLPLLQFLQNEGFGL